MKDRILFNWHWMRVIRLILGISIIVQGASMHKWIFMIIGILFAALALLNIGCCGTSSCPTNMRKNNHNATEVEFEEIK